MKRNERLSILNEQINITLKELEFTDNYKLDVMLMKLKNEKKKLIRELSKEYIDNDTLLLYDDNIRKTGYCNGRDGVKYYEYRIDE